MNYSHILHGSFLSRKNRFIAQVITDGQEVTCHVKNTGRLRELLYPGAAVLLEYHPNAEALGRKTSYSLIGVYKEDAGFTKERQLINIDSQAPNQAAAEWLKGGGLSPFVSGISREVSFKTSRLDLAFSNEGRLCLMEVKGVTLEYDGTAFFPDAPTERGIKHLTELIGAVSEGYEAYILFVIQMKGIRSFSPNRSTQPVFADTLKAAAEAGVHVLACDCLITETSMSIDRPVDVLLL